MQRVFESVLRPVARALLLFLCSGATVEEAEAQNLVSNGSFEVLDTCPDFWNQINRAAGWARYRGTPDYFNECIVNGLPGGGVVGVPTNVVGFQYAATGEGYAGGYLWCEATTNLREHLGAMLLEPLQPGLPAYISFRVSPTTGGFQESMRWAAAGAGIRFTMEPYLQNGLAPLPNSAAVHMASLPLDTSTWYNVSGTYIPDSAYEYVVLGNFFDNGMTTPVLINAGGNTDCAYVYYDDICVSQTLGVCNQASSMVELAGVNSISVYPVPFAERFTVSFASKETEILEIQLLDLLGRKVWQGRIPPGERLAEVEVENLPGGVYILNASSPTGMFLPVVLTHHSP